MKIPRPRIEVITLFVVAAVLSLVLLFLYGVTYKQISTSLRTSRNLLYSSDIVLTLEQLVSEIRHTETVQRGFLITRDSTYLKPYEKSKQKINASFSKLEKLLKDDETQFRNLEQLRRQTNKRLEMLEQNINISDSAISYPVLFRQRFEMGSKVMQSCMEIAGRMLAYQDNYLKRTQIKQYDALVSTPIIYFTIVLISLTIFVFLVLKLNSDRKKLLHNLAEISVINHSFEQAEKLAGLGYWRHNLSDGTNIFSDNYFTMLGISRGGEERTFRHLLKMVHPADRSMVLEKLKGAFRNSQTFVITYRVKRGDGCIRHLKSIAQVVVDSNNQQYLIGINMDVTELVVNSNLLEMKNASLELFNADLASFNYAASHDLQAPLRKIQMFITRIMETDYNNLSKKGAEYMDRMFNSAAQMQTLINDLLMFSRTTSGKKEFEMTDLNELLQKSIEELAETHDISNVTFKYDSLPVIPAIPYQLQQLFINLFSNSIKFAKPDIKTEITIKYQYTKKRVFSPDDLPISKLFHQISIIDNGIGFEMEYAHKLFNLLFRLHDKSTYPGSGIGLAICKKIVDNHDGIIEATSEPGQGSTFDVYLPVEMETTY
jgi:signal transduction histidine kinase/CHASE3 domain sensor protein